MVLTFVEKPILFKEINRYHSIMPNTNPISSVLYPFCLWCALSVAIIGLRGYVQYEIHIVVPILVRIIQKIHRGLVDSTHKNSGNKCQNQVKLNNMVPSNRDWAL